VRNYWGGLNRPIRILPFREASQIPFMNDALFLVLNEDLAGIVHESARRDCRNIGVYHMGDEFYDTDHSYYTGSPKLQPAVKSIT
jgi:hypothetical protein